MAKRTPEERFWAKVDKTETCWLWTAGTSSGYGVFHPQKRQNVYAHRYAYTLLVGPIPKGHELDHIKANGCTSTLCVKAIADEQGPAHLEPVVHRENILRGDSAAAKHAAKTHCNRGHPLAGDNMYLDPRGARTCRACAKRRCQEGRRRRRGIPRTDRPLPRQPPRNASQR
jgi:hypothetical protein